MTNADPPPTDVPIVDIRGLNKWYGEFHVLKDIDLHVEQGQRIVICGPLGSGKSTLIRCINRIETYQQGQIIVDGIVLGENLRNVERVRREVGMVFQHFNSVLAPDGAREPHSGSDLGV